jgi:hypothetical protein
MSRVRVTIDQLVLKGIAAGDGKALAEGLRLELARVLSLTESPGLGESTHTPVRKLGRLPLESGSAGARNYGAELARAIGKGFPQ